MIEAAKQPRVGLDELSALENDRADTVDGHEEKPWSLLVGSLIALFLSLGGNAYLGILLGGMRARYLSLVRERIPEVSEVG